MHPPPDYLYTRAISSYSAVIQLYICTGQLDTALMRHNWLSDGSQPWCRFSCPVFKDPHHIFVHCPCFASLHAHSMWDLEDLTFTTLDTFSATPAYRQLIISIVQGLFTDTSVWPLRQSLFYHGILPPVPGPTPSPQLSLSSACLQSRLASQWHSPCIKLVARIWGIVWCMTNPYWKSQTPTKLQLPSSLSFITLALSPSSTIEVVST